MVITEQNNREIKALQIDFTKGIIYLPYTSLWPEKTDVIDNSIYDNQFLTKRFLEKQ